MSATLNLFSIERFRRVTQSQVVDGGLWGVPATEKEKKLQEAIKELHKVIYAEIMDRSDFC